MTSIEWLENWMTKNQYFIGNDLLVAFEQAKEMHKKEMEISDEEIQKQSELIEEAIHRMFFKTGAKWYREQLNYKK
jgi:hypothetical protein